MLTASQHLYLVSEFVLGLWEKLPSHTTADEHGELLVVWASCPVDSAIIKLNYSPLLLGVFTLSTRCLLCNWLYNFQGETGAKKNNYENVKQADDHVRKIKDLGWFGLSPTTGIWLWLELMLAMRMQRTTAESALAAIHMRSKVNSLPRPMVKFAHVDLHNCYIYQERMILCALDMYIYSYSTTTVAIASCLLFHPRSREVARLY